MALKISTEPTVEPVSLALAKSHMRLDDDEQSEDTLINGYITTARKDCEKFQNRSYITQTWELWLDEWPDEDYIELPMPPLQSVTSVKYYDTDDTAHTLYSSEEGEEETDYMSVDNKDQYKPKVFLKYGQSWPSTTLRPHNGICVIYVAGYGDEASAVPYNIKAAMLLLISHLYEHREDVVVGTISSEMPKGADHLLSKERVY